MAEPGAVNAREIGEIFEREENFKEMRQTEKITSGDSSSSGQRNSGDVSPDPLAHLPENFRKEIEAQSKVVTQKISFKVPTNSNMTLISGTLSICRS